MKRYTKQELLHIANNHIESFTTTSNWDKYAKENRLPSSSCYKRYFGNWNTVKRALNLPIIHKRKQQIKTEEILHCLRENKQLAFNQTSWQAYSEDCKLPSYETIIARFGSWSKALETAGLVMREKEVKRQYIRNAYTKQELKMLARHHISHLTSKKKWDQYAKEHHLPSSSTFAKYFGSWGQALTHIGASPAMLKPPKYTKEELLRIAATNKDLLESSKKWRGYASTRKLPSYNTYIKFFGSWKYLQKLVSEYRTS